MWRDVDVEEWEEPRKNMISKKWNLICKAVPLNFKKSKVPGKIKRPWKSLIKTEKLWTSSFSQGNSTFAIRSSDQLHKKRGIDQKWSAREDIRHGSEARALMLEGQRSEQDELDQCVGKSYTYMTYIRIYCYTICTIRHRPYVVHNM